MWSLLSKQPLESAVLGIRSQHVQNPMDTGHLCLKLLEILLQALQLICSFVKRSGGLVDHAERADDELQSDSNEAHYASREAEWVHRWIGWPSRDRLGLKSRENAGA